MTRKAHPHPKATPAPADDAAAGGDADAAEIVERPDGYYWLPPGELAEVGPFESYELAQADRDAVGEEQLEPNETLKQAERDIGINDWIDVETGQPAEGQSPPHLEEE
jgi:hypothetical protein